ncbi:MAG: hypothetical protein QME66_05970 [Candidatus Eisenbacteria bacterium]|nr:hypothetical protein [Candidatus Eisenbacteria bacterium]
MPDEITKADEHMLAAKARAGDIAAAETEIEPQKISLPLRDFPELKGESEGDKVVLVLAGYVDEMDKQSVVVEVSRAAIVHGKMTSGQKRRVMRLEDALKGKRGIENRFALARHLVLNKKRGAK